jgi:hypothetical protein
MTAWVREARFSGWSVATISVRASATKRMALALLDGGKHAPTPDIFRPDSSVAADELSLTCVNGSRCKKTTFLPLKNSQIRHIF